MLLQAGYEPGLGNGVTCIPISKHNSCYLLCGFQISCKLFSDINLAWKQYGERTFGKNRPRLAKRSKVKTTGDFYQSVSEAITIDQGSKRSWVKASRVKRIAQKLDKIKDFSEGNIFKHLKTKFCRDFTLSKSIIRITEPYSLRSVARGAESQA